MQEDRIPKIFISYSWSSLNIVLPLAQRLMSDGVEVVFDKWELKEGQDKYAFMERCVDDPEITKVLIVSDKLYEEKANSRVGGVGDETIIISLEVYGKVNQEKFIPIVVEYDEDGNPCLPTYIRSRIYIDLSNDEIYESEYEKLLRNIYEKPTYTKPQLGNRPKWLDENKTNFFLLISILNQIKNSRTLKKQQSYINKFILEYIKTLKLYYVSDTENGVNVYNSFVEMKKIRNIYLDALSVIEQTECNFSEIICCFFEQIYNTLTSFDGLNIKSSTSNDHETEIYKIHIWELFIYTIAYLRYIQDYKTINKILTHTYFLVPSCFQNTVNATNFCRFRYYSTLIENVYKPTTEYKNKITILGHAVCCEREYLPIFTKDLIAKTDLFLFQVSLVYELTQDEEEWRKNYWFPNCYIYTDSSPFEWKKMKSRDYCRKMCGLFDVKDIDELKTILKNSILNQEIRYSASYYCAPQILNCIDIDEIGTVN